MGSNPSLVLSILAILVFSALIAANKGHTKTWKITTLSCFTVEYASLGVLYLWKFLKEEPRKDRCNGVLCVNTHPACARCIYLWNILSCSIAWALATTSLYLFLFSRVNYLLSLWIDIWAAVTWIVYWLVLQSLALSGASDTDLDVPGSNRFVLNQQHLGDSQRTILSRSESLKSQDSAFKEPWTDGRRDISARHPDIKQCLQDPEVLANSLRSSSSRIRLMSSCLVESHNSYARRQWKAELPELREELGDCSQDPQILTNSHRITKALQHMTAGAIRHANVITKKCAHAYTFTKECDACSQSPTAITADSVQDLSDSS
ncbi:hypothetical protein B0J14DRAFT_682585 [Halenospora varia]|nr:hypothetical protein B0J14DRAFT_682585 [Halenospora varia]